MYLTGVLILIGKVGATGKVAPLKMGRIERKRIVMNMQLVKSCKGHILLLGLFMQVVNCVEMYST